MFYLPTDYLQIVESLAAHYGRCKQEKLLRDLCVTVGAEMQAYIIFV